MKVTGERIVTSEGGFNSSWQRHTACYAMAAGLLPQGDVLDLGCGVGHAYGKLAPRRTVGLDFDHGSLVGQGRPTILGDMRRLPFGDSSFSSIACIHAIEHVPDAAHAVAESARVVKPGGAAVFVTPNRLTFGRPDEIIDPYHYVEYDPTQLKDLCAPFYPGVRLYGVFGSQRYMDFFRSERIKLDSLLKKDPLRLRRYIPRRLRQHAYDWQLTRVRTNQQTPPPQFALEDFELLEDHLDGALDLVAVCAAHSSGATPQ